MVKAFIVITKTQRYELPYGLVRTKKEAIRYVQTYNRFKPTIIDIYCI
jgi:hypothetical protein